MTQRYLQPQNNDTQWFLRANTIIGNSNENITITPDNSNNIGVVINSSSYLQIPVGVSAERPATGYAGMIRYLTSDNVIEYYNGNTGLWLPISQQPPEIFSINPIYVSDNCGGSPVTDSSINIVGENFGQIAPLVQFLGTNGNLYSGITTLTTTNTQCNTSVPQSVFDNSNLSPFKIKLTNNQSGLSIISTQEIFVQSAPYFTTNAYLGQFLQNTPPYGALDLSATDPEGVDISFSSIDLSINTSGTLDICYNGVINGFIPTLSSGSQNIPFTAKAEDTSGGFNEKTFNFDVLASYSIQTTGSPDISYIEYLNGVGDTSSNPYSQGSIVYVYKSNGTFQSNYFDISDVEYLVVGGGGGGGSGLGSGGGAGGFLTGYIDITSNINYSITVGNGGNGGAAGGANNGTAGDNSSLSGSGLSTITALGGGYGAGIGSTTNGGSGGSGGGGGWSSAVGGAGTSGQGNNGGSNGPYAPNASGGGGATQPGEFGYSAQGATVSAGNTVNTVIRTGGKGGDGALSYITGEAVYYAGGGGGARYTAINGSGAGAVGGQGGGGNGGGNGIAAQNGSANTGGGGGGGDYLPARQVGGNGGSGIVILRIPYTSLPRPNPNYLNIISDLNNIKIGLGYIDRSTNTLASVPSSNTDTFYIFTIPNNSTTNPSSSPINGTLEFQPLNTTITDISFIIVAGGGGGGGSAGVGGGGGAGGIIVNTSGFTFTQQTYTLTVGGGGRGGSGGCGSTGTIPGPDPDPGINGNNSSITSTTGLSLVAIGGGGGGSRGGGGAQGQGNTGGSGGGSDRFGTGGTANQTSPSNTTGYGNNGGTGAGGAGLPTGGGGGAGSAGGNGVTGSNAGNGGNGITTTIINTTIANNYQIGHVSGGNIYFGGGGGGAIYSTGATPGNGGLGGGGNGGTSPFPTFNPTTQPGNGLPHTGGGGGGTGFNNISSENGYTRSYEGGNGGSGVIILRFPSFN